MKRAKYKRYITAVVLFVITFVLGRICMRIFRTDD